MTEQQPYVNPYDYPQQGYPPPSYPPPSYPPPGGPPPGYGPAGYGPAGFGPAGFGPDGFGPDGPKRRPSRLRRMTMAIGAGAIAAALAIAFATGTTTNVNGAPIATAQQPSGTSNGNGNGNSQVPSGNGNGGFQLPNGTGGNSTGTRATATAKQQIGVVDIDTKLGYQSAAAAGTGLVIDSAGYILTNNHVIDGATTITVTVVSTGRRYAATVVGTSPTNDIAVLHLANASGLQTATLGDSDTVKVSDKVTGVGNAGGAGGTPSAAVGTVQALNQTITASDESGASAERLSGVIATDAPIQAGDSGGPLFNAKDQVVGINTAASTNGQAAGFAIPINKALSIAQQIRKGIETSAIHIGYPAFLGVSVKNSSGGTGALIGDVVAGLPAAKAGIVGGDVITKVNNTKIGAAAELKTVLNKYQPGDEVTITYLDAAGTSHQVTITLIAGPAD